MYVIWKSIWNNTVDSNTSVHTYALRKPISRNAIGLEESVKKNKEFEEKDDVVSSRIVLVNATRTWKPANVAVFL